MANILVIGIGNVILSDDGVGPYVVRQAEKMLSDFGGHVDFKENYSGGFDLLYELAGYERVIIVDCMATGKHPPGTVAAFTAENLDGLVQDRLVDSHGVNLPTVLETGRRCGYRMPDELIIYGIEAEDVTTFSETLTEKVRESVEGVINRIREKLITWIEGKSLEIDH